jgi:hypothetical protein
MKDTSIAGNPGCDGTNNAGGFVNNCRFFYTGLTMVSTSVEPTRAQVLANPVQRSFRGNTVNAGSVKWLRLTADSQCAGGPGLPDNEAASQSTGANRCFYVDMGLKGGVALDQDEEPLYFNDGIGSSQMGALDCDPSIQQGQEMIDGVVRGCNVWYAAHPFDWNPLCPSSNDLFTGYPTGNPGTPWNDGRWPPLRCIKTRPTGSMNQLDLGLNERLFGDPTNPQCPADSATGWVKGRNYWHRNNNLWDNNNYADNGPPKTGNNLRKDDPRLVTIFLAPAEAFTASGQNTYPITGFVSIYITGYGRIGGSGNLNIEDPCPGNTPPSDLDVSSSGMVMWGHVLNHVVAGGGATGSGEECKPVVSTDPCVAVLVE